MLIQATLLEKRYPICFMQAITKNKQYVHIRRLISITAVLKQDQNSANMVCKTGRDNQAKSLHIRVQISYFISLFYHMTSRLGVV